jgi:hypothetical protein
MCLVCDSVPETPKHFNFSHTSIQPPAVVGQTKTTASHDSSPYPAIFLATQDSTMSSGYSCFPTRPSSGATEHYSMAHYHTDDPSMDNPNAYTHIEPQLATSRPLRTVSYHPALYSAPTPSDRHRRVVAGINHHRATTANTPVGWNEDLGYCRRHPLIRSTNDHCEDCKIELCSSFNCSMPKSIQRHGSAPIPDTTASVLSHPLRHQVGGYKDLGPVSRDNCLVGHVQALLSNSSLPDSRQSIDPVPYNSYFADNEVPVVGVDPVPMALANAHNLGFRRSLTPVRRNPYLTGTERLGNDCNIRPTLTSNANQIGCHDFQVSAPRKFCVGDTETPAAGFTALRMIPSNAHRTSDHGFLAPVRRNSVVAVQSDSDSAEYKHPTTDAQLPTPTPDVTQVNGQQFPVSAQKYTPPHVHDSTQLVQLGISAAPPATNPVLKVTSREDKVPEWRRKAPKGNPDPGSNGIRNDWALTRNGDSSRQNISQALITTGAADASVFRPMTAVSPEKLSRHCIPLHIQRLLFPGFSDNYLGDRTLDRNASADISDDENCALWITRLPADTTHHDLLAQIRGTGGRIYACVINPPTKIGHHHSAAKVVFFERSAAERLFDKGQRGEFIVGGYRCNVAWNRIKTGEQKLGCIRSRALVVMGDPKFVNEDALLDWFSGRFMFDLDEAVTYMTRDRQAIIEWRFASYRCQAEAAKMALAREQPDVVCRFGPDPCA